MQAEKRVRFFFFLAVLAAVVFAATAQADGERRARGAGAAVPGRPGPAHVGGGAALEERRRRTHELFDRRNPSSASPPATVPPTTGRRVPAPTPAPSAPALVHLHHGSVHMGAGLARVQLTLEVENVTAQVLEWQRTYAIDPRAEVLGAVLKRENERAIHARTLTEADASRLYARIRTPRRTQQHDPLLITRPQADQLAIRIWPVMPSETIRVELTFVTPLRGNGARRTYRDVMGGPTRLDEPKPLDQPEGRSLREPQPELVSLAPGDVKAAWLMQPGELVLSSARPDGMVYGGEAGGLLHFTGRAATEPETPAPRVDFLTPARKQTALMVGNGTFRGRIATWRFDPREFLGARGYALTQGLRLKLVPVRGSCTRLAPHLFRCGDEPQPVTTLVSRRDASAIRYEVLLLDRDGDVLERFPQSLRLERKRVGKEIEGAVSGWHRAALARRVFDWAGSSAKRRAAAQRFAVDVGVLVPGTAALAVPDSERFLMTAGDRRLYDGDGVPLGAQRHEADLRRPPRGSLKD